MLTVAPGLLRVAARAHQPIDGPAAPVPACRLVWKEPQSAVTDKEGVATRSVVPRGLLFHVTTERRRLSIERNGIEPRAGKVEQLGHAYGPRVFLCDHPEAAQELINVFASWPGRGAHAYVIAVVDPARLDGVTFYEDEEFDRGVWTDQLIPPAAIVRWDDEDPDWEPSDEYWNGSA
jgi:hypothetical protein